MERKSDAKKRAGVPPMFSPATAPLPEIAHALLRSWLVLFSRRPYYRQLGTG